jgi:hypothetical protein
MLRYIFCNLCLKELTATERTVFKRAVILLTFDHPRICVLLQDNTVAMTTVFVSNFAVGASVNINVWHTTEYIKFYSLTTFY